MNKKPDYSSFFYLNPLPSWVYDLETFKILDVNQAAISHYGYTKEEFLQLNIKDLRPKEEIPKLVELLHSEIEKQEGNIYLGVFNHKKKNGDLIRMEINGHKVDYLVIESMIVVGNDVTEEEAQIKNLKLSEERLQAATSIAKLGYWRLELDAKTLSWTDEIFNIWGRERHGFELTYENFFTNIHPEDRELFTREQNASFAGEKEHNIVHRIILPDDSIRWVHELGRLVKDENGKPVAFEGTVQDITGRKEEEQRLKLLESVITNTNDAVMITEAEPVDESGPRIIYVNEAFTKMTGYTSEEVIGKTPRILQGPKSDKAELARLKSALINWESCEITTINYKKNGEEFWINLSVSPVANEKGWYTHFIAIERDVTEQKNKEREQELLGKISLNFSIDNNLHTSADELCKTISEFGQFDFVELWLPNIENTQIQLLAHKPNTASAETFYEWSKDVKYFYTGEGLAGIVWLKKSIILWDDISKNVDFIRKEAAEKAGIQTALGIPLLFNKKCVGVLVIGAQTGINYLKKYVPIFEQLEDFIGSEISRKKLEKDLNHLYEAIPDILCLADFEGRFLKMNKAGCELLGCTEEEMLYHSFDKFVHPEDKDITRNVIMKLGVGQTMFKFENRYLTKTGNIVWLSWTCNSTVQEGLIYASAKNITEEKKLRELNSQASIMAKIGSWEIDLNAGKLFWADMVHNLHETEPASFTPDLATAINFYREDFRPLVQTYIEKAIATGEAFDFEAILVTTRKNECWVRVIGNAELVDGQCKRIYGSFQDINDSKMMELQMREILGSISDAFYAVNKDWNFTYFNKEAENLLLKKAEVVIGKNIWQEFPAAIGTSIEEIYCRVAGTGASESFEYFFPGDNNWYEINAYPSNGGVSAYFKNIDERKKAHAEIAKSEEKRRLIMNGALDAIITIDTSETITFWNAQAEVIFGWKAEEVMGKPLSGMIIPEPFRKYHIEGLKNYLKTGEGKAINVLLELSAIRRNGEEFPIELTVIPIKQGGEEFFCAFIRDITQRKKSEAARLIAEKNYQELFDKSNDAIYVHDIDTGQISDVNYRATELTGFDKMDFLETNPSILFTNNPEYSMEKAISYVQKAAQGNPQVFEWLAKKKDGTSGWFEMTLKRTNIAGVDKILAFQRDITERKKYENQLLTLNESIQQHAHQLELSNEELEQFAYIASHDLQEPLRMISGFLDQLKRKYGDRLDEKGHQYIHFATDGAKRMKQIILDLLDYSRAGKLLDSTEEVDMNEVLEEYKLLRRKMIAEKNAEIFISKLPVVKSYKAPVVQTLHCLLDNAIKYSREGQPPHVTIDAEELADAWKITIADNGIGIDAKFFEKIFILFQQLHNRDEHTGNGIGLSIAKKQVESWGGNIGLDSTPGKGSVFYFTHPKNINYQ